MVLYFVKLQAISSKTIKQGIYLEKVVQHLYSCFSVSMNKKTRNAVWARSMVPYKLKLHTNLTWSHNISRIYQPEVIYIWRLQSIDPHINLQSQVWNRKRNTSKLNQDSGDICMYIYIYIIKNSVLGEVLIIGQIDSHIYIDHHILKQLNSLRHWFERASRAGGIACMHPQLANN